jgi:hypothetical protein
LVITLLPLPELAVTAALISGAAAALTAQIKTRSSYPIKSYPFFFFPKTVGVHQTMLENVVGSNFQRDFFKNKLMTIV